MRKDFLIYEEIRKYFPIYEEAVIVIYDFATGPLWISLHMIFYQCDFQHLLATITCGPGILLLILPFLWLLELFLRKIF
jgi:hypothetical protein